jgi:hypothetical protein
MGCNCGKSKNNFKKIIQKTQEEQKALPVKKMTRAERIAIRALRIKARNERIARRVAMMARKQ